jgi:hypothetical protein
MGGLEMTDAIKWHDWSGGVRDIAAGVPVAVRWRNGNEWQGDAADFQWQWQPEPQAHDIVAYAYIDTETWEDDGSLRAAHGSFDAEAMQKAMEAALPRTKAQADEMMLALNAWDYKTGTVRKTPTQ